MMSASSIKSAGAAGHYFEHDDYYVDCSGQLKLATVLEFSQYNRSDSLGVKPPLY